MEIFEEYIRAHDAGMVLVTHDEALARRCTHLYRMQNGLLNAV